MKPKQLFSVATLVAATFTSSHGLAIGQLADVEIIDRTTQRALPVHWHEGEAWVVGTPGTKYSIRVRNSARGRVLAIMSVDGVNVLSGQTASTASASGGYVFNRWQSASIHGWRKSDDEVAAFYFTDLPDTYAARTGRPDHVGVIGVALYREQGGVRYSEPMPSTAPLAPPPARSETTPSGASLADMPAPRADALSLEGGADRARAPAAAVAPESAKRLGTGHGEREVSPTQRVSFVAATAAPAEVIRIRYDSRERLVAMGVLREPIAHRWGKPNAFPRDGFVPDPPASR
jgi:hypothetical protein